MLLGIDVLRALHDRGETAQTLSGSLGSEEAEVKRVLDLLVREGLVSVAGAQWGSTQTESIAVYVITPAGRQLYERVLTHFASRLAWGEAMTGAERFLLALANDAQPASREQLLCVLDGLPEADRTARPAADALNLGQAAVSYARRALESSPETSAQAAGLASLGLGSVEELGYVAGQLREYSNAVGETTVRELMEAAASACEAAWEVRRLGARDPTTGRSRERLVDQSAYAEVAECTARALQLLARITGANVIPEAENVIAALVPGLPGRGEGERSGG
jgi:DNA-binding MarR family transcriptional regulator